MKQETPVNPAGNLRAEWGGDAFALALRNLGLKYIGFNLGASYLGLHGSLVNFLGNESPHAVGAAPEALSGTRAQVPPRR